MAHMHIFRGSITALTLLAAGAFVIGQGEAQTKQPANPTFYEDFEKGLDASGWRASDHKASNRIMDVQWSPKSLMVSRGELLIAPRVKSEGGYVSGELQRRGRFKYGHFEATLQPARGDGVVTSLYTYSGPSFGTPAEQISLSFAGRDTTKMSLEYAAAGGALNVIPIDLGFDAADAYHRYGFDWEAGKIAVYVDGRLAAETPADAAVPSYPAKLFINAWVASPAAYDWFGAPRLEARPMVKARCVSMWDLGAEARACPGRVATFAGHQ